MNQELTDPGTSPALPAETKANFLSDEVRVSELRYRRLFEAARDGIFLLDIDTLQITDANPFMTQLLGYPLSELIGKELWQLGVFSDREASKEAFRTVQDDGYIRYDDLPLKTKQGKLREVEFVSNVYDEGDVQVIQCNIRDISGRKQLEKKQAATEERFKVLFEYAPDGILIASPENYYLEANASMCRMLGYSREELIGMHAENIVIPSEVKNIGKALDEIQSETNHHRVWRFRRKDGSDFSGEVLVTEMPDGNLLAMIRDITEREKADNEKALLTSKIEKQRTWLDNIVANVPGIVWETVEAPDESSRDFVSGYVLKLLGYSVEEWYATPNLWLSIVHPEDRERVEKHAEAARLSGENFNDEFRWVAKDGRVLWVEARSTPIFDENGAVIGARGVTIDITERRRAEQELRDSEEKFSAAFEFAPIGVGLVLPDGRWHQVNRSLCDVIGYSEAELLKLTFQDITHPDDLQADLNNLKRLTDGEITYYKMEKRYIHKLGSTVTVLLNVSLVRDDKGDPRYFIAQVQDITERNRADDSLRESESLLAASQRITHLGSWVIDLDGNGHIKKLGERWSDEHYRIFGYEPGEVELTDEFFFNAIHPGDRDRLAGLIREAIAEGRSFDTQHRIILPDGSERTVQAIAELVLDEETGKPVKLLGSVQDITEWKRAEEDLQRQQTELRVLFDLMPAMIWFKDTENNILRVNRRVAEAAGRTVTEMEGKPSAEIYPLQAAKFFEDDQKVLRSREAKLGYVEMISDSDGEKRWIQTDKVPYFDAEGNAIGIVVMAQDVTERRNYEHALLESDEKFHQLADNITDAFWIRSRDMSKIYYISPAYETIWGRPIEMEPVGWLDHILPEDRQIVTDAYASLMHDVQNIDVEYRIRRPDGSKRWVRSRGFQVRDPDGAVIRLAGIITDITEKKEASRALTESEERYRELFENAIDIIYTHDLEGNYTSVNKAAERVTGYTTEEALMMNVTDTVAPNCAEKAKKMISAKLKGEEVTAYELDLIAKDGHRLTVEVNTRILYEDDKPVGVQGIARDITNRKSLEGQLRQSQKMEAVGVLAGGIAHDFNNLLTAINGYSALTLKKMPADDPCRRNIEEVKHAGDRAAELTSQLLAFSRKQVLQPVVINVNSVLSNIERMLRRIIRESIEMRVVLDPQLGNIQADPGQIEQVIMNLAINARDAMQDSGTLTIETHNVYLDEHSVPEDPGLTACEFVRMTVTDTGQGMDSATQSHIFEPFFTTKEVGKGTGLGLSTVYGIVKQSGGHLEVFSELGVGTTFKIYLPCVAETIEKRRWAGEEESSTGTETILLVEDEEIVRTFVRTILSGNGYNVLEAANGKEALAIGSSYAEPIHMLLTDVIMPKMSGTELRDQLHEIRPDVKSLFMSGYTHESISQRGVLNSGTAFIEKPFSPESLSRKIREVLEA